MHIVEQLLDTAYQDSELLIRIESQGDNPHIIREVDFALMAPNKKAAETVCSFINDNRYGEARVEDTGDEETRIVVIVNIPLYQNIVSSMSANFVSLSHLFSVDYIGWGCCVQTEEQESNG